jgi:hypothetical protein
MNRAMMISRNLSAFFLSLFFAFGSSVANASLMDILGPGQRYIKITNSTDTLMVKFEDCIKGAEKECSRFLGPREWYYKKSISNFADLQFKHALWVGAGDLALVVAGGATFAWIGSTIETLAGASGAMAGVKGGLLGGVFGFGAGGAIAHWVEEANAFDQYEKYWVVSKKIIDDQDDHTSDLEKAISLLEDDLRKI